MWPPLLTYVILTYVIVDLKTYVIRAYLKKYVVTTSAKTKTVTLTYVEIRTYVKIKTYVTNGNLVISTL